MVSKNNKTKTQKGASSCDVEKSVERSQNASSHAQLAKLTGRIVLAALCAAGSGCSSIPCLATTHSMGGELNHVMIMVDILSSLKNHSHKLTSGLKSHADAALAAGSSNLDNGQCAAPTKLQCMKIIASSP